MKVDVGQVGNLRTDCLSVQASRARLVTAPARLTTERWLGHEITVTVH
jgi:hypothetical protein